MATSPGPGADNRERDTAANPAPGTRPAMGAGARWGILAGITCGALVFAVVASFLGLLYRGDFASGGSSPVVAAILWGFAAVLAALPVALLPLIGFLLRPVTAIRWATALGATWFVVGYFVLS